MDVFKSNGYHDNFIINCFKAFLDKKHNPQERVMTEPQNTFLLIPSLPWTTIIANRNKLREPLKGILQLLQTTNCI